uniref:Uncharacterized protein n=1 Tax=Hanusia phi TaxID=3032 RepID=A0A7S0ETN2_9CRYP|mmetsp:Transcript_3113/g.7507  ORF Transcript_3113/g.7507 Transcript_3113/m.7507 type:complete len:533 (+) Transcript_3113:55-1653(+)
MLSLTQKSLVLTACLATCLLVVLVSVPRPTSLLQAKHGLLDYQDARSSLSDIAEYVPTPPRGSSSYVEAVATGALPPNGGRGAVTAADLACFLQGKAFLDLMNSCCNTLYVSPFDEEILPMDFALSPVEKPYQQGLPFGVRFRYWVGNSNDIVFNGGTERTIEFINRYFGLELKTVAPSSKFIRKFHADDNGEPDEGVLDNMVHALARLPEELPLYEGMTTVDVSSLPPASAVIYDNVPKGTHQYKSQCSSSGCFLDASGAEGVASPMFKIKYCEARDPEARINAGLPVKVEPQDCGKLLEEYNLSCKCGHLIFLGWTWPEAELNIWDKPLLFLDDRAPGACDVADLPAQPMPAVAPRAAAAPAQLDPEAACRDSPSYDAAAQHWYYWQEVAEGGRVKMVRHWCPSAWVPQEMWYKYQRYLPHTSNNLPPPPINDFDFLNSFARDYYSRSRAKARRDSAAKTFDDWSMGNHQASLKYPISRKGEQAAIPLDRWNQGRMRCSGSDCFDVAHHGGQHDNGVQPYNDYETMGGGR